MHRFFCPQAGTLFAAMSSAGGRTSAEPAIAQLDRDETHHAKRVLRLNIGDKVELLDGAGHLAQATIQSWEGGATLHVDTVRHIARDQPHLTLAVAIPKGPRADDMISQLCQLGVDRFIPLRTQRSVVDPRQHKLERLGGIVIDALKQSGRVWQMRIDPVTDLADVLRLPGDCRLIACAATGDVPSMPVTTGATRAIVLIGPEGGWSDQELADAQQAGLTRWTFNPHTLRIETAALAAAAIVRALAADKGG
ncbi:MAG: 16S rRNA (uracil(1498)-N(3))-methyltransferase [Phycisphaeraceae bacterium]